MNKNRYNPCNDNLIIRWGIWKDIKQIAFDEKCKLTDIKLIRRDDGGYSYNVIRYINLNITFD